MPELQKGVRTCRKHYERKTCKRTVRGDGTIQRKQPSRPGTNKRGHEQAADDHSARHT